MSDLIKREDAIEAVASADETNGTVKVFSGLEIIDMLNSLPSAESTDNWIPVSERLPNKDGQYLVFYEGTIIGSRIEIMWYGEPLMPNVDVSGKHFYRSDDEWGDIIYDEVIAWMPLPTPYKESEVKELN